MPARDQLAAVGFGLHHVRQCLAQIVVIILFVMLIITAGPNNITGTESFVGRLLSPVQSGLYTATEAIGGFFSRMFSVSGHAHASCTAVVQSTVAGCAAPVASSSA